jgi:hypothetical protein
MRQTNNHGGLRPGAGRPSQGKIRRTASFSAETIRIILEIGGGNFSLGVEIAARVTRAYKITFGRNVNKKAPCKDAL